MGVLWGDISDIGRVGESIAKRGIPYGLPS